MTLETEQGVKFESHTAHYIVSYLFQPLISLPLPFLRFHFPALLSLGFFVPVRGLHSTDWSSSYSVISRTQSVLRQEVETYSAMPLITAAVPHLDHSFSLQLHFTTTPSLCRHMSSTCSSDAPLVDREPIISGNRSLELTAVIRPRRFFIRCLLPATKNFSVSIVISCLAFFIH